MLADIRSKKGLSQNELAALSGVSARVIKAYEQGDFGFPHGQTHSGLRPRGTKGRSRLRNRSLVALIGCLRRI